MLFRGALLASSLLLIALNPGDMAHAQESAPSDPELVAAVGELSRQMSRLADAHNSFLALTPEQFQMLLAGTLLALVAAFSVRLVRRVIGKY